MADNYGIEQDTVFTSSMAPYAVTPHDTTPLAVVPKALYIGGAGNVALRGVNSSADVTFVGLTAGSILMVRASHVRATLTTATGIIALA